MYRSLFLGIRETIGTERFDLVLLNRAPIGLRFEVVTQGRLVFSRGEETLNRFEMDVIRRYQDTAYLRRVQDQYLKQRAERWFSGRKASARG